MTTRKCPHCAEEIQAAATKCKHCQSDVEPVTPTGDATGMGKGCLWLVGVFAAILIGGWIWAAVFPEDDRGTDLGAIDACHQAVKERLKSPASAKFSNDRAAETAEGQWTVTGAVDSENSFGAMIRGTYSCQARYDGDESYLVRGVRIE